MAAALRPAGAAVPQRAVGRLGPLWMEAPATVTVPCSLLAAAGGQAHDRRDHVHLAHMPETVQLAGSWSKMRGSAARRPRLGCTLMVIQSMRVASLRSIHVPIYRRTWSGNMKVAIGAGA